MNKFDGKENNINSNQVDHRIAKNTDERTMVNGLEAELLQSLRSVSDRKADSIETTVKILSTLIDAKIELDRVQMATISGIKQDPIYLGVDMAKEKDQSLSCLIDFSLDLEALPAFLPLTDFTPEQFAMIRNGDRFNVDGRTMHVRFEKKYIPGLRSLKVIKGID